MIRIVSGLEFCCRCSYLASYAVIVFILFVYIKYIATLFIVTLCIRMAIIIFKSCI